MSCENNRIIHNHNEEPSVKPERLLEPFPIKDNFYKPENLLTVRIDEGSMVLNPDNPVTQQPSNPSPEVTIG